MIRKPVEIKIILPDTVLLHTVMEALELLGIHHLARSESGRYRAEQVVSKVPVATPADYVKVPVATPAPPSKPILPDEFGFDKLPKEAL